MLYIILFYFFIERKSNGIPTYQTEFGMLEIKKECTGCMACVNGCPIGAINIKKDEFGFAMPEIDIEACVDCGQCELVCPINGLPEGREKEEAILSGKWKSEPKPIAAWSMFHMDEKVVEKSSSGGAFYALAEAVLEGGMSGNHTVKSQNDYDISTVCGRTAQNDEHKVCDNSDQSIDADIVCDKTSHQTGIVFGCMYDISSRSAYLTDTDHVSLDSLLTSKYVESYISEDGLRRIKSEVETGRQVLFCGTPCQAAGLRSFLGRDYDNLLIVDFACGGVAAQPYLSDYISSLEAEHGSQVIRISFRDKHYGWGQYCFLAEFEDGSIYRKTAMSDPYFFSFLRSSMQRLSCHGCHFSDAHRSDICLSDFWRCDFFDVERNDRRGLSMALAFTEKGQRALEELKNVMHMDMLPLDGASYHLKSRFCPESKLEEIYRDMGIAINSGVKVLRESLLSEEELESYERRQQIMDDENERHLHPEIVGNGQIVPKPVSE